MKALKDNQIKYKDKDNHRCHILKTKIRIKKHRKKMLKSMDFWNN